MPDWWVLPVGRNSLEANHLIWVWIMKVKGPKNQADFIEVLATRIYGEVIPIGSEKWRPLGVTGPPKDEIYIQFHRTRNADFLP